MELKNPFITEGYAGEKYFCDREEETSDMQIALASGRNITLISPRRMGKTGLIKHVFEQSGEKGIKCFYIDILTTTTLNSFIQLFARALLGGLDGPITSAFNTFAKAFRSCRPTLTPDEQTGIPTLSLEIRPGEEVHTLKEVFDYLAAKNQDCYIAIDEFQQITEYPETNVEALLRSYIQFVPHVTFIFAGSKKHLMQEMFSSPKRPFYQSTQPLSLKPINQDKYYDFASYWFHQGGKQLPRECFDHIYSMVMAHTWYIQYWLSILYDYSSQTVTMNEVEAALNKILSLEDDNFYQYTVLMTKAQLKLATAIAKEKSIEQPLAKDFISKYDLPATSTVKGALTKLIKDDIIMEERGVYSVYNRFFLIWLRWR
jgi:AAA+ ATPase superfamily predicted ATPase